MENFNQVMDSLCEERGVFDDNFIIYLKKYNISQEKILKLRELYIANNHVFKTIKLDFINSVFFDKLNLDILKCVTSIESQNPQNDFLKLNEQKREVFFTLLNSMDNNLYWPAYVNCLLKNFNNEEFQSFINSIDVASLDKKQLKMISCILTAKKNNYGVTDIKQINNIEYMLEEHMGNYKERNDLEKYKNSLLLKSFNLSLEESKLLCQKYAYKLNEITQKNSNTFSFLTCLKHIIEEKDIHNLEMMGNKIVPLQCEYPFYQTIIQQMYEKEYNQCLFKTEGKNYENYNNVLLVDAGVDFNFICRAEGAFTLDYNNTNYGEKWNNSIRDNYSFSNSHVSNSRLLTYSLQSDKELITYGFDYLPKNSIVESALGDNATMNTRLITIDPRSYKDDKKIYPTTFDSCGQRFLGFKDMINESSMSVYTEITLERFYKDENGNEKRLQPSYIIYFKLDEDYKDDNLFIESMRAAKDFGVPIVVVDVEKVLQSEKKKVIDLLNNGTSVENIIEVVQLYSNNCIKNLNDKAVVKWNKYFPLETNGENMVEKLINVMLEKESRSKEFYQSLFDKLMVLNAKKRIISNKYLVKMSRDYSLNQNFDEYYNELYGITCHEYTNLEKSNNFYDYISLSYMIKICENHEIDITDDIMDLSAYDVKSRIEKCDSLGININKDILLMDRLEFRDFMKNAVKYNEINKKIF